LCAKEQETPKIKYSLEITRPVSSVSYNTANSNKNNIDLPKMKTAANRLMLSRKMSTGSLTKPVAGHSKQQSIFKQSGNASVQGFADYYKDVI